MKTETAPAARMGIVDAIGAGLTQTRRHPWLMLIPMVMDFCLWLGPRVMIGPLLQRALTAWESLVRTTYPPDQLASMEQPLRAVREVVAQLSTEVNLADGITGGWLGPPSVLATSQVTRMTFISDLVLAPAGLSLQLPRIAPAPFHFGAIEIGSLSTLLLAMAGFWLVGQVLVFLWLVPSRTAWRVPGPGKPGAAETPDAGLDRQGTFGLFIRLVAFGIGIGAIIILLRLPLAFAVTMLMVSASSAVGLLSLLFGGVALWLTLWFLLALFFVCEGLLLEGQPLGRSLALSVVVVHRNFAAAIGLAALINLLVYSFRIIWDLLGQTPLGVSLAIVINAYLVTSMLLAIFAFFDGMRRATVAQHAKVIN